MPPGVRVFFRLFRHFSIFEVALVTRLMVPVTKEFSLDAGQVTFEGEGSELQRVITPPAVTMFEQLVAYLDTKPMPPGARTLPNSSQEGVAAAALCLRWGSYFAVLADQSKPLWKQARTKELREEVSRISDDEMARINIEASAAMAALVDINRSDLFDRFGELVAKTLAYLPIPQKKVPANRDSMFPGVGHPDVRPQLVAQATPERQAVALAEAQTHPSRVFANALVNHGWRNGPVEHVHAGKFTPDIPLDQCRITSGEVRDLVRFSAGRFQAGFNICLSLRYETPQAPWWEQVLGYNHAQMFSITPREWSLTETSREVREFLADPGN